MSEQYPRPAGDETIEYQGKILEIVNQPFEVTKGKIISFEKARRSPGVRMIFAKNRKVLLTREYRAELESYDFRLPGGKVFDTLSEYNDFLINKGDLESVAKSRVIAEAKEETGMQVNESAHLYTSKLGATVEWDLLYFEILDFKEDEDGQQLEHGEDISVQWTEFQDAEKLILDGQMSEERSALVLLRYLNNSK